MYSISYPLQFSYGSKLRLIAFLAPTLRFILLHIIPIY